MFPRDLMGPIGVGAKPRRSAWTAADTARYPNAKIEETIEDGVRAYFTRDARDRQQPIQVSLGRRQDGKVDIEVRVPPFARPQMRASPPSLEPCWPSIAAS